jgi:hypothetical protein
MGDEFMYYVDVSRWGGEVVWSLLVGANEPQEAAQRAIRRYLAWPDNKELHLEAALPERGTQAFLHGSTALVAVVDL